VHFVIVKKEPQQSTYDVLKFMQFNCIQKDGESVAINFVVIEQHLTG